MEIFTRKSFRFLPFCATLRCIGAKIAPNYNNHHRRKDDGDCCIGCLRNHLLHFHTRSGILAAVREKNEELAVVYYLLRRDGKTILADNLFYCRCRYR